jgi:hypothetical protein
MNIGKTSSNKVGQFIMREEISGSKISRVRADVTKCKDEAPPTGPLSLTPYSGGVHMYRRTFNTQV